MRMPLPARSGTPHSADFARRVLRRGPAPPPHNDDGADSAAGRPAGANVAVNGGHITTSILGRR